MTITRVLRKMNVRFACLVVCNLSLKRVVHIPLVLVAAFEQVPRPTKMVRMTTESYHPSFQSDGPLTASRARAKYRKGPITGLLPTFWSFLLMLLVCCSSCCFFFVKKILFYGTSIIAFDCANTYSVFQSLCDPPTRHTMITGALIGSSPRQVIDYITHNGITTLSKEHGGSLEHVAVSTTPFKVLVVRLSCACFIYIYIYIYILIVCLSVFHTYIHTYIHIYLID